MRKNIRRILSVFILTLTLTFTSIPLADLVHADDANIITIVHTNDMHGRLSTVPSGADPAYTLLSRLDYYVDNNDIDFLFDAGDAIQGMPISNLNKGLEMLNAMEAIGYDAMTLGNHEFDFGLDNIEGLRDLGLVPIVSNNVSKEGTLLFDRNMVIEKGTNKVGVIGVTTPETATKTHPNNIVGVEFLAPVTQVTADLNQLDGTVDLIVVLAHLGVDTETPLEWRGNYLAGAISELELETPVLVIDGHSHTEFPEGTKYGTNVLYAQTGQYLNNIGRVDIDLDNFENSTATLIPTASVVPASPHPLQLEAEEAASAAFDGFGEEVLYDDLQFTLEAGNPLVRRREAALGNLITDAMMAYGKGFSQQPDLAIINGGGIRAAIEGPEITLKDVITVLPFGNMYSSIEVTGQQILEMFEYSYNDTPAQDDNGNYVLNAKGGFLHVSGAKVIFNSALPAGERVLDILFDTDDGWVPIDLSKTYILATNDFLAAGGDGFTMLGGPRIEGNSLDSVVADFLRDHSTTLDWSAYEDQTPRTRILQIHVEASTIDTLDNLLDDVTELDEGLYTKASYDAVIAAYDAAVAYLTDTELEDITEAAYQTHIDALTEAIEALELLEDTEDVDDVEDDNDSDTGTGESELPATGHESGTNRAMALIGLGALTTALSRRKREEQQ